MFLSVTSSPHGRSYASTAVRRVVPEGFAEPHRRDRAAFWAGRALLLLLYRQHLSQKITDVAAGAGIADAKSRTSLDDISALGPVEIGPRLILPGWQRVESQGTALLR